MIQIRWEHFVAPLLLIAGVFLSAGAWLSYGVRVAVVTEHADELGVLATQLASQVTMERVGYIVGGVLVAAAVILWIIGSVRGRERTNPNVATGSAPA